MRCSPAPRTGSRPATNRSPTRSTASRLRSPPASPPANEERAARREGERPAARRPAQAAIAVEAARGGGDDTLVGPVGVHQDDGDVVAQERDGAVVGRPARLVASGQARLTRAIVTDGAHRAGARASK